MGIISINVNTTGLVGDQVNPRRCTLITTDNLATVTAAGYLNNQNKTGNIILPTDIFNIIYGFNTNTQSGTFGIFQVSYAAATGFSLVLWENPGNVLLPVVSGDFANFNGITGQISDAGFSPTDATKTKVVMLNAAPTINHVAIFTNANGTIGDGGVLGTAAAKAASDNTKATLASVSGATVLGNFAKFADTAGTVIDGGAAIHSGTTSAYAGGGTTNTFTATGLTSASIVTASNLTSTNSVSITKVVPGTNTLAITWSADPGAATTVNWISISAAI